MENKEKRKIVLLLFAVAVVVGVIVFIMLRDEDGTTPATQERQGLILRLLFADTPDVKSRTFKPGEPIDLKVHISNNTKETWSVDKRFLAEPALFVIKNSRGKVYQSTNRVTYPVRPVVEQTFEPGEVYSFERSLFDLYPHVSDPGLGVESLLTPDDYSVQVVLQSPLKKYEAAPRSDFPERIWPDNLESDVLRFTVRQPTDDEIHGYIAQAKGGSEEEVIRALAIIGAVGAKKAVPDVLGLVSEGPSEQIRIAAIMTLRHICDKSIARDIERIVIEEPSTRVGTYAAGLLGQLNDKQSVPILIQLLEQRDKYPISDDGGVWYAATVRSLGDIGDERAIPVLTEIAETDPTDWVRHATKINIERIREASSRNE